MSKAQTDLEYLPSITTQMDHLSKKANNFGLVKVAVKAEMTKMRDLGKALGVEITKRAPESAKADIKKVEDESDAQFARGIAAIDGAQGK